MSNPAPPPGLPPDEDSAEDTALDPAFILRLLRELIPIKSQQNGHPDRLTSLGPGTTQDASPESSAEEPHTQTPDQQENAGCILWDLSSSEASAGFLVRHQLLDLLPLVLQDALSTGKTRLVEILTGILGNLACHAQTLSQLSQRPMIIRAITMEVMWLEDPACLGEACRLISTAVMAANRAPWLQALQENSNLLPHLLWIVQNTLNEILLERGLNLLVALACQGSPILDALLPLGLVQTALGPLESFAADLDTTQASGSPPGPSTSFQDDMNGAAQRNASSQQAEAAIQSSPSPVQGAEQQPAEDTSYRDGMQDAAISQQGVGSEAAADPLADPLAAGEGDEGGSAGVTDTRQPIANTIADSALRLLEAVAVNVRHVLEDAPGLVQLLLQLLRDCDSPEVLESVVAVLTALEAEEAAVAIAQDGYLMRQVLSTLHRGQPGSTDAAGADEELSAPLHLVSMAAPRIAVGSARQLEEVLDVLSECAPPCSEASAHHLWCTIFHQALAAVDAWLEASAPSASQNAQAVASKPSRQERASVEAAVERLQSCAGSSGRRRSTA